MASVPATVATSSAATLIERLGALPVEHGRSLIGLSMKDVFEHVRDSALQAARQKQSESSSKSQNLLRAYCKARLAVEELEQVAVKFGLVPRQLAAPGPPRADALSCVAAQTPPETTETTMVLAKAPLAPCSSTSLMTPSVRRIRTTKDGHFRPLAIRSSPSPIGMMPRADGGPDGPIGRGVSWILEDLGARSVSTLGWVVHCMPLCVHALWFFALCGTLYVLTRPQLLVRGVMFCTENAFRIATTSGSELLLELDKVLLDSSSQAVASVAEAADPLSWAQRVLFQQPDSTALLEQAVSLRLDLEGNSSYAEVVKVAARIAAEEAHRQVASPSLSSQPAHGPPPGSGIMMSVMLALTAVKAGKFLL